MCTGERTRPGVNDLATTHPKEAEKWPRDRMRSLSARDVNARSRWVERLLAGVEDSDQDVAGQR